MVLIRKIEAGVLEIIGREDNLPTLKLGKNETVGSEIPTIWTEKDFFTTKGSTYVRNLFGDKRFPYPKPLEFIVELLRATTTDNSLIVVSLLAQVLQVKLQCFSTEKQMAVAALSSAPTMKTAFVGM